MTPLTDERGVLIEEFDVLRVFHYIAARRREKIYMYKHVRKLSNGYLVGHHLTSGEFKDGSAGTNCYNLVGSEGLNSGRIEGTRVVQSNNWEKL